MNTRFKAPGIHMPRLNIVTPITSLQIDTRKHSCM